MLLAEASTLSRLFLIVLDETPIDIVDHLRASKRVSDAYPGGVVDGDSEDLTVAVRKETTAKQVLVVEDVSAMGVEMETVVAIDRVSSPGGS